MRKKKVIGSALILGALLAVAVPEIAYANTTSVVVQTPGATPGPGSTFSEIETNADCANGALISGGGINQTIGTGMNSNGNHVMGTEPSSDGTTEFTSSTGVVATDIAHWLAFGGTGGGITSSFSTTPYAVCFTSNLINHTQVVMNKVVSPASSPVLTVATCPANTALLGGGARSTPASVGSPKPIASYPTFNNAAHDFGQKAAADGETNPDSWAAVGSNGGGGDVSNTTYAYAICSGNNINVTGVTVKVRHTNVSGPTSATSGQTATVGCGAQDGRLLSGGAAISGGDLTTADFVTPGSQGDHLNGSYPSDAAGSPVGDGSTTAASWTAATHTGGANSPNTFSDVWALCANDGVSTTSTSLVATTSSPLFGHLVTFTASVTSADAVAGIPNGTVTFSDGAIPLATVAVTNGQASFSTSKLQPGSHSITASYSGSPSFAASTTPAPTVVTVGFSQPCITTSHNGPLTVTTGQALCVGLGGIQQGPVTVAPGGALAVSGAVITGPVSSTAAAAISVCQSTVNGPLTIQQSSGYVLVGANADDAVACPGITITGPVNLRSNTGGLEASANTITGPVQVTGNTGSGLLTEDAVPEFEANHITGSLACSGNTPAWNQTGNTATGPRTGQCKE